MMKNEPESGEKLIGIQIGAMSFTDEGVDKFLDVLQEHAGKDALMLASFTYGRGIAGRQIPGHPLPAEMLPARPKRLPFLFLHTVGWVVCHARKTVLRLAAVRERPRVWIEIVQPLPLRV